MQTQTSSPHFYPLTQITVLYHQLQVKNRKCSSIQNLLALETFPQSLHLELPFPTAKHTHTLSLLHGVLAAAHRANLVIHSFNIYHHILIS